MVAPDIGPAQSASISDDGAFAYVESSPTSNIYTSAIDLTGRSAAGSPVPISGANLGNQVGPSYSPDGRFLAYVVNSTTATGFLGLRKVIIHDPRSGSERELHPSLSFVSAAPPQWTSKSEAVVIWGKDVDGDRPDRMGFYRVDVQTSETTLVVLTGSRRVPPPALCWPDGRALLYLDDKRGIVSHDFETGRETVLVSGEPDTFSGPFGPSPDGRSLAFTRRTGSRATLNVQTDGGPAREVLSVPNGDVVFQGWTLDGRAVLYTKHALGDVSTLAPDEVLRISTSGGSPESLHLSLLVRSTPRLAFSPDLRSVAYAEGGWFQKLWIHEGFVRSLASLGGGQGR
jgi:Tol biopolymer transport system component